MTAKSLKNKSNCRKLVLERVQSVVSFLEKFYIATVTPTAPQPPRPHLITDDGLE